MKYGIKIKNIEASTLLEYNNGIRDHFEYKDAMFTNSLFNDFLQDNGLKIEKNGSTKDIICLEFNWGSRSYEDEHKHLYKLIKDYSKQQKELDSESADYLDNFNLLQDKRKRIIELYLQAKQNKYRYHKMSKQDIREKFYTEGVSIPYVIKDKNGEVKKTEVICYKMLFRSTGKAKKGSCMFIRDKLYKKSINYLRMGLKLQKEKSPIVEISAYAPLVSSTIIGKIKINPRDILILKDVDSFFKTKVVSVGVGEDGICTADTIEDYTLKNTMFDGQALIDESVFPSYGDGYVLLRQHFCKMASFSCNIQKFFKDYYKDDYEIAKITDMFGVEHYAKDIKLITTDNAMKWLKFDVSYDYWCERVLANGGYFGVVKTAHQSKLGDVQKMSYQMVNCLDMNTMPEVISETMDYIEKLKKDDEVFANYLLLNKNFSNDYEVLYDLYKQDNQFAQSEYFRERKTSIIDTYIKKLRTGKIIQDADNLVFVGSPYAMLLYTVGEDVDSDTTLVEEKNAIQCYTKRFEDGAYLAGFRSPHNSQNNILYLHNVYSDEMDKYFNLGKQIIALNVQHTDVQDRANGCDFDSDSGYITNQPQIVERARECYINYPTIVNNIPKETKTYENKLSEYSKIDNNLAESQLAIGESSNLAQLCLTYSYNFDDAKYQNYVCILSVLAQVAIDNAKRRFAVDLEENIKYIKNDINVKENGYPIFWGCIHRNFNMQKINKELICPMNVLSTIKTPKYRNKLPTLPMNVFYNHYPLEKKGRPSKSVEKLIKKYSIDLYNNRTDNNYKPTDEELLLMLDNFETLVEDIKRVYISRTYIGLFSWLIDRAFAITNYQKGQQSYNLNPLRKNRSILLKTLYDVNKSNLLQIFAKNVKK